MINLTQIDFIQVHLVQIVQELHIHDSLKKLSVSVFFVIFQPFRALIIQNLHIQNQISRLVSLLSTKFSYAVSNSNFQDMQFIQAEK